MPIKKDTVKIIGRAKQTRSKVLPKKLKDPSHSQLCKAICDYMRKKYPQILFIHIPNEGNLAIMGKLKAEGLVAGCYDYLCAKVKMTYDAGSLVSVIPGLWIEVKTKKDKLSKEQKEFKDRANKAHYSTVEVYSIDEFIEVIEEYLK
jgi:hypothetical protein